MAADTGLATIWTIGHSTHALGEFLALLDGYDIEAVADVRRFPGSRRYPQFARDALEQTLPAHGIGYRWLPKLGGRRLMQPDSPNTGWRNASFRGYADYLASTEFGKGLHEWLVLAALQPTTLMCAEALWWRCHRSLIADVLRSPQPAHRASSLSFRNATASPAWSTSRSPMA